jgi:2-furoyl-CoA dehydrogenase 2Fe-2S iron sulfur subunit
MRYLSADAEHQINFTLNGKAHTARAEPRMLLSDFLRDSLGHTGTHVGCEHGVCGACTVNIDGQVQRACLTYAVQIEGREVQTVEGLARHNEELTALQSAFKRHHALQCGFCTPGILMSLSRLVETEADADETRVREMLSGHLCRCTGYHGIVAATLDVLAQRRESRNIESRKHV